MSRFLGPALLLSCCVALLGPSNAHAELLGYWSANSPNEDFLLVNDQGNTDLDGEIFGEAAYTEDQGGVTGAAGDYALQFGGTIEDYAALPHSEDVTFEEITLTAWMKGIPTGDWSGIFYSRGATALGLGYGGGSGNLTYTWNDNVAETWNFGAGQPQLNIPPDEWTFVALTVEPDNATLYVGPQGGTLESATNEIPHIPQLAITEWRLAQDNCCGNMRNFEGSMDDAAIWNHRLTAGQLAELHSGAKLPNDPSFAERLGGLRQVQVAGGDLGIESFGGTLSDVIKGDPVQTEGLAQYWFEGNLRTNVEFFLDNGETGTEENPLVTSGPFASDTTWWAGSQDENVISDYPIPKYPAGLAGTKFDGSSNANDYGVRLTGEIFIASDGEVLYRDGIDDFTLLAIDQDGNGELDDFDSLSSADVGLGQIGDVLVLDDDWANLDGSNQEAQYHGIAEFENVPADGEWRKIEIWMSEGGGGDGAILYGGSLDDENIFDDTIGDALSQEERDAFVIRNDQLRSTVSVVESANSAAELATNVEYVLQVNADGSDQFSVDDSDGVFTTTLNVAGANILVEAGEGIADGAEFTIFDADNLAGLDTLNLTAEGFDLSRIGEGIIVFGAPVAAGIPGDIDGNGTVEFADFLTLSNTFGQTVEAGTGADLDGDGEIAFGDFLILSNNFGQTAAASAVPEPSGLVLLGIAGLIAARLRRRRM